MKFGSVSSQLTNILTYIHTRWCECTHTRQWTMKKNKYELVQFKVQYETLFLPTSQYKTDLWFLVWSLNAHTVL